jgi:signal transduction histidine kinase
VNTGGRATIEELRAVPPLADLPDDFLEWLAGAGEILEAARDERVFNEGDPAEYMLVVLRGSLQVFTRIGGQPLLFGTFQAGRITGVLPFSRIERFEAHGVVQADLRSFRLHRARFPEMLQRSPELGQRLVGMMSDRVRDTTRTEQQREKMSALGKLSAGLAHELNNPASAVRRSAVALRERLETLPPAVEGMLERGVPAGAVRAACALLTEIEARPVVSLSAVGRAEREDEVADWLGEHGIQDDGNGAEALADAGFRPPDLDALAALVAADALPGLAGYVQALVEANRLAAEIGSAAARISELVASVKSYSHQGRAPDKQPTDVRKGIDSTLIMLGHELKAKRIQVTRKDAPDLQEIPAYPGELNQVFTNLIDNAIDALPDGGELHVETGREGEQVLVRIVDNGPGIPESVRSHIFEPFFTTKAVGEGTGLGLDIVQRIVRQHSGQIDVESRPGRTVFTVRLPAGD